MDFRGTLEEFFWTKVDRTSSPNDCWFWTGNISTGGYGRISTRRKDIVRPGKKSRTILAHRLSWEIANDPIPHGLCVMHDCPGGDKPHCVNPAHLKLGTLADNCRDRHAKGRTAYGDRNGSRTHPESRPRGENNPSRKYPERLARGEKVATSKLTAKQVRHIRQLHANGKYNYLELGQMFGVSNVAISCAVQRKTWRHIK